MKSAAGQQGQPRGAPHVVQRGQLAGLEDHLEVRVAAGRLGRRRSRRTPAGSARPGTRRGRSPCRSRSAPAATASRTSCSLVASEARPDGNAVATLATCTPVPRSASTAVADQVGVDAHRGDRRRRRVAGIGPASPWRTASAPCRAVSAPSSVVRSTIAIAVSIAQALAVVLMLRVASAAARRLGARPGRRRAVPCRKRRSGSRRAWPPAAPRRRRRTGC